MEVLLQAHESNMEQLTLMRKQVAFLLETQRLRNLIFVRDYPSSMPEKRIKDFTKPKPNNSNSNWDEVEKLRCTIMAYTHDYNRLVDHLLGPPIPDYMYL